MSKRWATSDSKPAPISSSAPERPVMWKTIRRKNVPPSGSVEYWSDWWMLAPCACRKPDTAATIPGRSSHLTSRRPVSKTGSTANLLP